MAIDNKHPDYVDMASRWELVNDAMEGEEHVKGQRFKYLPPTPGQVLDGATPNSIPGRFDNPGMTQYESYLSRAIFPDYLEAGVETLVGILNAKPATVVVPERMKPVLEKFTAAGEDINSALRRLHAIQLSTGRAGLFVDMPKRLANDHQFPYVAIYKAEDIINWDEGETEDGVDKLNLVVLHEAHAKRDNAFNWTTEDRYRTLVLGDAEPTENGKPEDAIYRYGVLKRDSVVNLGEFGTAMFQGRTLNEIPFVFVNTKDTLAKPDKPPLLGLARMCFNIYKGEADYRRALFNQGEDTLVVVGGIKGGAPGEGEGEDGAVRIGAGSRIDVNTGGDAKFIGFSSQGLSEQRTALDADRKAASVRTGQLLAPGKSSMESGEALKTRVAAQTATLSSIATTAAKAVENSLKMIARWIGADESQVRVTPNLEFVNAAIQGQDIVQMVTAKNLGAPISAESIHTIMAERGLTKKTFEEEIESLKNDPEVLKKIVEAQQSGGSLAGNNPLQSAGGPKQSTEGSKAGASNKPKE